MEFSDQRAAEWMRPKAAKIVLVLAAVGIAVIAFAAIKSGFKAPGLTPEVAFHNACDNMHGKYESHITSYTGSITLTSTCTVKQ